jgi:2'-5' RNA ligase
MKRLRTFVAVAIPDDLRKRAMTVVRQLAAVADNVKWVEPESLHWTLQFLGPVPELEVGDICAAVADGVFEIEPFELTIRGASAFPSPDRPRTLWLGVGQGHDEMIALQAAVEKSLEPLGFRGEARRFTPHLTIGRPGRGDPSPSLATELAKLTDFDAGTMLVDEVTIFSSELTLDGPIYSPLRYAPLSP